MKKVFIILFSLLILLASTTNIFAVTDPLAVPNNKFGIHIFNENDLDNAAKLVNSSGGDWGYVTIVIAESERDHDRWQKIFDQMRRLHLIPIIRIATKPVGSVWEKPKDEEINNWVAFLNSLNWVIQNRYVVIGNEPNLDNEWGGKSNAIEYASYLESFSQKLKSSSSDFFVLPAGFAPEPTEFKFIRQMLKTKPQIFDDIDGWTSHSYPTASVSLYSDELKLINKDLPVFITETGWSNKNLGEDEIGNKFVSAYQNEWNNPKIVAVTPFILNYPQPPFGIYSWEKSDGTFYNFFNTIVILSKTKGEPVQITRGTILAAFAQPVIPSGADYIGLILAKNTGQSIWNSTSILVGSDSLDTQFKYSSFEEVEPGKLGLILFKAASPENTGIYTRSLFLKSKNSEKITNNFPIEAVMVDLHKISDLLRTNSNGIPRKLGLSAHR